MAQESKIVELLLARGSRRRLNGGIEAFTEVLKHPDASPRQRAVAAFNRGLLQAFGGHSTKALEDWTRAIEAPSTPFWLTARTALARGHLRLSLHDAVGAVCDFTTVICLATLMETHQEAVIDARVYVPQHWSPLEMVGRAIVGRGRARSRLGDMEGALVDLLSVFSIKGLAKRTETLAWARLAEVHFLAGRYDAATQAVQECLARDKTYGTLGLLSALAALTRGELKKAVDDCTLALSWALSVRSLDFIAPHMQLLQECHGKLKGMVTLRTMIEARRKQLQKYAPSAGVDHVEEHLEG